MIPPVSAMALVLFVQDPSPGVAPSPAPADIEASNPDAIAARLTGESDPCVRREAVAREQVEQFQRQHPRATAAQLKRIRDLALEMFQASADMSSPQGSPPPDYAAVCAAPGAAASGPARTRP